MPLVVVCRNPATISDETLKSVVQYLPELVAGALTVPDSEGVLTSAEVEVWVQDFGPFDVTAKDIEIIIWAHDYPERLRNFDERQQRITRGVRTMLPHCRGYVWVLLQPTSFGEW